MDAVFFDIGGVLLDSATVRQAHERFVSDLYARSEVDDPESALETWRTELGAHFREREGTEFRSARAGYERAIDALGVDGEWESTFERVLAETIEPNPGAVEAVETLAGHEVHLGVISDVDAEEGRRILDTFDVREAFDSVTISEEVGWTKPDPAMFETALGKSETVPERSLMVGDRYRHDIEGAKAVGLRTAIYGAEDGPAVDHRLADLREIPALV
ncbi:HAD family hydrolase [Halalkalicoccus jeotgali]|uniref:HAD superfamily hydrolase n=1 Tax=Halalkalicoccus jeotgali (strain DSM 18796 / CECT 7217 / JCM 14584 / KCTC 4019 / B3) TaxID=795797 RepID=D8J9G3_HALJB|nr:HAD family hydrolase [Halalkalicoccus jeotgali]ADJ14375.1 HAD-superfamily hydrolase, subfamily IA, variant 1 [Halalkalicoccus jeotgali B3]ELY40636.1 HAD superfamily hydrolase [Halalkalicoccus jeotgali B3]